MSSSAPPLFLVRISNPLSFSSSLCPLSEFIFHREYRRSCVGRGDSAGEFRYFRENMGSKTLAVVADQVNSSNNRSTKDKVPKMINKAAREKLKREHLNELFLELANALELNQSNNGKASILCEATRFLKDLFGQIESLRKEKASLLSESHYVTVEKNELKEERWVLETQISELQTEIDARVNQSKPDLNAVPPLEYQQPKLASHFPGLPALVGAGVEQPSAPPTVLVLPVQPDLQTYRISDTTQTASQTYRISDTTQTQSQTPVRKPHPRYASDSDSWQSRVLEDRVRGSDEVRDGGKSSNSK